MSLEKERKIYYPNTSKIFFFFTMRCTFIFAFDNMRQMEIKSMSVYKNIVSFCTTTAIQKLMHVVCPCFITKSIEQNLNSFLRLMHQYFFLFRSTN